MSSHLGKAIVSSRAKRLTDPPPLPYIQKVIQYREEQYDEKHNPSGKILLCVAENKLCTELLQNKLSTLLREQSLPNYLFYYTSCAGLPSFREEISKFFKEYIFRGCEVNPNNLFVGSGCIAMLTSLSIHLFEDNESVLIPVPYYPAFDHDFFNFANVHVQPIHCANPDASNLFGYITEDSLDQAYSNAEKNGHPPRAVLLSNPNNPMGLVYSKEELQCVVKWTSRRGLHLIMDEIYALSVFPSHQALPGQPQEPEEQERFVSAVELLEGRLGDHVHIVWSFSKDFGGSGLRVGVLYSQNRELLAAVGATNDSMMASNLTQFCMESLIKDEAFLRSFLQTNSTRLFSSYSFLSTFLTEELGVRLVRPVRGGIFIFADFRRFLREESFAAESELFERLAEGGVVFTPGHSCHCPLPGFFRICYAFVPLETLRVACGRLRELLLGN